MHSLSEIEVEAMPGVTILVHECTKPRGDWSPAQPLEFHGLVLVRRGGFRLRLEGHEEFIGPSMAFFEGPIKDRKSTRLNSSHVEISYAVFCLKKKTIPQKHNLTPQL